MPHRPEQHAPPRTRRRRQEDLGREEAGLARREASGHLPVRDVDQGHFTGDGVGQGAQRLLVGVNGRDAGLVVEKVDGGFSVRRPEEVHQVLEVRLRQHPAAPEIFECSRIVLGVSRVAERPPAERELEAVGRDRMEVPAGLELSVVGRHLDPHSIARVRGDVSHQALSLEVAPCEESRLLDEGAEDRVRGDHPRRAPAHELLDEPTVVVSVDVGQEHVQHIRRRDPDLVEVGERFRGRIDEDALAVDPDDEARKVATRVEAVAGSERCDPEPRPVARELNGLAELGGDGPEQPRRRPHLEFLLARPAVRQGDANVEPAPGGRHSHLRRRQRDDGRLAVESEEVHVRVDPEERAFRAAIVARGIELMGGAQEVVRLARPDAVRLGELLEGRRLRCRRVEEAEQRESEQPMEDVPLPGGAGNARARLLAQEEV